MQNQFKSKIGKAAIVCYHFCRVLYIVSKLEISADPFVAKEIQAEISPNLTITKQPMVYRDIAIQRFN